MQTLLREKLFDRLDLWVYPVVLGAGKKVFEAAQCPRTSLLEPPAAGPKGTVCTCATGSPMARPGRGI